MMINGIIFDFGNVICSFDIRPFLEGLSRFSRKSITELRSLINESMDIATQYESGMMSSDEFYATISAKCRLTMPKPDFISAYCGIFTPIPSTFDLIRKLKTRYRLGLLSNTSEWHFEYGIKPVEVFPLFDAVTLSFEVKALKPARKIYDDVLHKLELPPERCAYIDDIGEYVEAAQQMGIHSIHYGGHEKLVSALSRLKIRIP
jgi:putative hydrolase of the HAD superfamily